MFSSNYQDSIDCPICRSKVQFPRGVLSKLPKNHLLLDLMESVGLKDRLLNQKQIHTILTDVSTGSNTECHTTFKLHRISWEISDASLRSKNIKFYVEIGDLT